MSPPEFCGSKAGEDPQLFLEEIRKIIQVMHISKEESVKLASYILIDIVYEWVVAWRKNRWKDATPLSWQEFQDMLLDKFFSTEMREAKIEEFMNLR